MPPIISAYKLPARCLQAESAKRNGEIAAYIIVDRLAGIKELLRAAKHKAASSFLLLYCGTGGGKPGK